MKSGVPEIEKEAGAIGRALPVLRAVADAGPCSVREVAEEAGIPLSTAYRLVNALVKVGFLSRGPGGTIQIGWTIYNLASVASRSDNIAARAGDLLRELSRAVGETAFLAVRNGERFVFVAKAEVDHQLRTSYDLGVSLPIPTGALGHIFATFDSDLEGEYIPAEDAARIREQGYAVSDQLAMEGVFGIAAPVFDFRHRLICAITIAGPTYRFKNTPEIADRLLRSCGELSRQLGYGGEE